MTDLLTAARAVITSARNLERAGQYGINAISAARDYDQALDAHDTARGHTITVTVALTPMLVAVPGGQTLSHGIPRYRWACTCPQLPAAGETWPSSGSAKRDGRRHIGGAA